MTPDAEKFRTEVHHPTFDGHRLLDEIGHGGQG
jgi:hypothetical protein